MPVFYMEFDHVFIFSETQQATTVLILYILKYFGILSYSELLITFDDSCHTCCTGNSFYFVKAITRSNLYFLYFKTSLHFHGYYIP